MHASLNLLPPAKKQTLHAAFALVRSTRLLWALMTVTLFCAATLIGVRMMIERSRDDITAGVSAMANNETSAFAEKTRAINTYVGRIDARLKSTVAWSHMLQALAEAAPPGVQLSLVRVDAPDKVHLTGVARTRADVLQLKDTLEASPVFTDVRAPLSNILSQRDVVFDFDMRYAPPAP